MEPKKRRTRLTEDNEIDEMRNYLSFQPEMSTITELKGVSDEYNKPTGIYSERTNISEYSLRTPCYAHDDISVTDFNKNALAAITTSKDDLVLAYKTSTNRVEYIRANKDLLMPWAQAVTSRQVTTDVRGSPFPLEVKTAPIASNTKAPITSTSTRKSKVHYVSPAATVKEVKEKDVVQRKPKYGLLKQNIRLSNEEINKIGKLEKKCNIKVCDSELDDVAGVNNEDIKLSESPKSIRVTHQYDLAMTSTSRDAIPKRPRNVKFKLHKHSRPEHKSDITEADQELKTAFPNMNANPQFLYRSSKGDDIEDINYRHKSNIIEADQELKTAFPNTNADPQFIYRSSKEDDIDDINYKRPKGLTMFRKLSSDTPHYGSYTSKTVTINWAENDLVDYRVST